MQPLDAMGKGRPTSQYLTFRLASEEYAVDILAVHEIKVLSAITPIPNTPEYLKGVVNLRGTIVPVVDLRERFSLPAGLYDRFTVFVIMKLAKQLAGLVVDAVTDVLTLGEGELDAPPVLGGAVELSFVRGLARTADRLIVVLDFEAILREALVNRSPSPAPSPAIEPYPDSRVSGDPR